MQILTFKSLKQKFARSLLIKCNASYQAKFIFWILLDFFLKFLLLNYSQGIFSPFFDNSKAVLGDALTNTHTQSQKMDKKAVNKLNCILSNVNPFGQTAFSIFCVYTKQTNKKSSKAKKLFAECNFNIWTKIIRLMLYTLKVCLSVWITIS